MNKRIGLFTELGPQKKKAATTRTTSASYVDVGTAKDLVEKLQGLGARQVGLLRRDRLGVTHLEGKMLQPADISDTHLEWLTAKPEGFETRGIYYATK
jgi:hypothetical protein